MTVSVFDVLDTPNKAALKWKAVQALAREDTTFPITIRERLDELSAKRHKARTFDALFRPSNIDLDDDEPVLLGTVTIKKHVSLSKQTSHGKTLAPVGAA